MPHNYDPIVAYNCIVTAATGTSPETHYCAYTASSSPPTYHDWILVNELQIFFLCFIMIGILFNFFRK